MRITTWNMQGGVKSLNLTQVARATRANVLCLQECGNLVPLLRARTRTGVYYRGILKIGRELMECVFWPNRRWTQGGMAVLSNLGVLAAGVLAPIPAPYNPAKPRRMPWVTVPSGTGPLTVLSIHSPPVWRATLADVCAWNNTQIGHVNGTFPGDWAVVGDFNADPTSAGFAPPPRPVIRGPRTTQEGGGLLDYAVTNAHLTYVSRTFVGGGADHYPQVFHAP